MEQLTGKALVNARMGLQTKSAKSSLQRALDDRLTFSETTALAGDLIGQFPNLREVSDGFIGSIASVLLQYPRQVCLKCADPRHGLARHVKFLSIAELVNWLEKQTEPLRVDVSREHRVVDQLKARADWESEAVSESLKEKGRAWLERIDPKARQLAGNDGAEGEARRIALLEQIQRANNEAFEQECKHAGIDPERNVTPSLLKALGQQ